MAAEGEEERGKTGTRKTRKKNERSEEKREKNEFIQGNDVHRGVGRESPTAGHPGP